MAPKAAKKDEPAAKKAKTSEPKKEEPKKEEELKKEEPKTEDVKDEGQKFQEPDAPKDNRSPLKEKVVFPIDQMTLNVVPTLGGQMLTTVTDGGLNYLLAGARANVGVKAGRYMFEVRIIQTLNASWADRKAGPAVKVGFSTADSSLFLGEDAMGVAFGTAGEYVAEKRIVTLPPKAKFTKEKTIAVVLNLDPKSPNANTVSLYLDGESIVDPKPLPEGMKGKPLFPTVTFRNVSIQVSFGPTALKELPFKCRLIGGATNSDVTVTPSKEPKDGKYEVVLPVAFPDEGTFAWVDDFLEKNPQYVELSDRKIAAWCKSSGLWGKSNWKGSNDEPSVSYGIRGLDDYSVRTVIQSVAQCVPRNYVIMEVKNNLLEAGRIETLKKFSYPCFKKVAHVVMGKPNKEFKEVVQNKILKEKQSKAEAAWKAKKDYEAKKKAADLRKKEVEKSRKAKEDGEEKKEEDVEVKDEPETKEGEGDTEPPPVELTEEEKAMDFLKSPIPDLTPQAMNANYAKFTTPKKEEGFHEIRYAWEKESKAEEYLQNWVMNRKLTTRIEDLVPGQYFKDKAAEFEKSFKDWQAKQKTAKKPKKKTDPDADEEPSVDVFAVTDINDIGDGVPLYSDFAFEDWELTRLRFELTTMLKSFRKDCDDPDRVGVPLEHVSFYYGKYFKKSFSLKMFGVLKEVDLFNLIKDTVAAKNNMLQSELSDDTENSDFYIRITEKNRQERQRRIDAGDETAKLKFVAPMDKSAPKVVEKPEIKSAAGTPAPKLGDGKGASKGKGKVKSKY